MTHKLSNQLQRVFDWLTDPVRGGYSPGEWRKAKLTTIILLFLTLMVLWETTVYGNALAVTVLFLLIAYIMSRYLNYKIAAVMMIVVLNIPSFLVLLQADPASLNDQPLQWLLLPIILASFLFSLRGLVAVVLGIVLTLGGIALISPMSIVTIVEPVSFLIVASLLIVLVAYQRDLVELERETALNRLVESSQREIEVRHHIEKTLQQKMEQMDELRRLTLMMTAELNVEKLLNMIVTNGLQLLGGDLGGLFLFDEVQDVFILAASSGEDETAIVNRIIPRESGIIGQAWASGEPVFIGHYHSWHGRIPEAANTMSQESFIAVPLSWQDAASGVLILAANEENYYAEEDTRIINFLAAQATVALQNAQLNNQIRENANQLQTQIGQRERAENAMRDSQEMLRAILDSIPIRVFWKDMTLNYLGCNQPFAIDAGFPSPDDIIGKTDYELAWKPEEAKFFRDTDRRIMQTNQPEYNIIEPQLQADGRQAWLNTNKVPLKKHDGELFGVLGTYEDISNQIEAQQKLKRYTKELEFTNRELQKFAYVASHDLQEPLRKIQQFGDRLVNKYSAGLDARGLDYLDRMQKSANRMQVLIQDLLDYSRVTMGSLEVKPIALAGIIKEVIEDLEARIEESNARIIFENLPTIEADPVQMKQLFQNLISNAIKFSVDDEIPVVQIEAIESDNGHWQISVTDNGIGFDEKYEERIFGVFQRLQSKQDYEGTGIGLALCKQVVEQHGGEIWAKSHPGNGATFIIKLPATQPV